VLSDDADEARNFLLNLQVELQRELEQADVLIIEREVRPVA
jgi:hypothetical protein